MKLFHWATTLLTAMLVTSPQVYAGSYSSTDYNEPLLGDYKAGSIYFGGALGYINSSGTGIGIVCGEPSCSDMSWKAYAGYQATEKVAAEVSYHNLGHQEHVQGGANNQTSSFWNVNTTALSASAKISTGMFDKIDAFGRIGFMAWNAPIDIVPVSGTTSTTAAPVNNSGTDLLVGVGADYKIGENLSVRGEYEHVGGDLKAHMFSLGANYKTF